MFQNEYYCLIAGLREYAPDGDTKGFDIDAIRAEILDSLTEEDVRQVELLYGYYDCENIAALRSGRAQHNPLGNFSHEELEEELRQPNRLPEPLARVVKAFADPECEEAETIDVTQRFEAELFAAYYELCREQGGAFLRAWSEFDRTLRNVTAAVTARTLNRSIEEATVGEGDIVEQLKRSSAADFGLRGELQYVDAVITAVNDESNLVEKEHKIDQIRWNEAAELSTFDYFTADAVLAYLVRVNIVARWTRLDPARGREMFERLMKELDGKHAIEPRNDE